MRGLVMLIDTQHGYVDATWRGSDGCAAWCLRLLGWEFAVADNAPVFQQRSGVGACNDRKNACSSVCRSRSSQRAEFWMIVVPSMGEI